MALKEMVLRRKVLLLIAVVVVSCTTKRNLNDQVPLEQENCGGFSQRGYGEWSEGDSITVSGKISCCSSGDKVSRVVVMFFEGQDTIKRIISNKDGTYKFALPPRSFAGSIGVQAVTHGIFIREIYLSPAFKNYNIDIKLPKLRVFITEDGTEKDREEVLKIKRIKTNEVQ